MTHPSASGEHRPHFLSAGDRAQSARLARWVALSLCCVFVLSGSGYLDSPDAVRMFQVTESLVERGSFAVRPFPGWERFGGAWALDARSGEPVFYSWFGLGSSLAALPSYLMARLLRHTARDSEKNLFDVGPDGLGRPGLQMRSLSQPEAPPEVVELHLVWYDTGRESFDRAFTAFGVSLTNAWVVALIGALVFLVARELGHSVRTALITTFAATLASPMWAYAKTFFGEPLSALGLMGFVYFALRGRAPGSPAGWWGLAGFSLGVSALAKLTHLGLAFPAGLLLLAYARGLPRGHAVRALALAAACFAVPVLAIAGYNQIRFGSPLTTGLESALGRWDTPFLEGVAGLLVSPGRGLIWYFPLASLCAWAMIRSWATARAESLFALACLGFLVVAHARWFMWEGGWCWGPRFLVPAIPLLTLGLAPWIEGTRSRIEKAALWCVGAISLLVSVSGTLVNFIHYDGWIQLSTPGGEYYQRLRWDWHVAPLMGYWNFPLKDYFLLPYALKSPGLVLGLYGVFAAGLMWGAWKVATGARVAPR